MSNVLARHAEMTSALSSRTLRLLRSQSAAVSMAMLKESFPKGEPVRDTSLHQQVEAYLRDLDRAGVALPCTASQGGAYFVEKVWMRDNRWVSRRQEPDGTARYHLTADAVRAMEAVSKLSGEGSALNGQRAHTLVDIVDRCALAVNPDYEEGLRARREAMEAAEEEYERYRAAGGAEEPDPEVVLDSVDNMLDLFAQVPGQLLNMEELYERLYGDLERRFLAEESPGAVVGAYLEESDRIYAGDEGRAYLGVIAIFSDPDVSDRMRSNLRMISRCDAVSGPGSEEVRGRLRSAWGNVTRGIDNVNRRRDALHRRITAMLKQSGADENRAMAKSLAAVRAMTLEWARGARRGQGSPVDFPAVALDVERVRTQQPSLNVHVEPPPLEEGEWEGDLPTLEDLKPYGAPRTDEVLDAMEAASGGEAFDLAAAFSRIPDTERRTVEVVGLLCALSAMGIDLSLLPFRHWEAVEPDGSRHLWLAPSFLVEPEDLESLKEATRRDR